MRPHQLALLLGFGAIVACGVAADHGGQSPVVASTATQGPPSVSTAPTGGSQPVALQKTPLTLQSRRAIDWTASRIPGRATYGLSDGDLQTIRSVNKQAFNVDWNITTGSASVNSAAAISGNSWLEPTPLSTDQLFFGVNSASAITPAGSVSTTKSGNFFALNNLYATSPTVQWAATLNGAVDDTAVAIDVNFTEVFVVDSSGSLWCFPMGSGPAAACTGGWGVNTPFSPSSCTKLNGATETATGSSPWVDYEGTTDIYYADTCGRVHRVYSGEGVGESGKGGTEATGYPYTPGGASPGAFESSPLVLNGVIYIGDDMGRVFAIEDGTSPVEKGQTTCAMASVSTLPCGWTSSAPSSWAVRSSPVYNTSSNLVYFQADDYIFELQGFASGGNFTTFNFVQTGTPKHLSSGAGPGNATQPAGYIMTADLSIDTTSTFGTNPYLYTSFNNYLFKVSYPFTTTTTIDKVAFANQPGTLSQTTIGGLAPYPYQIESSSGTYGASYIWAGDATGVVERFDCAATTNANLLDGTTSTYGTRITSSLTGDYSSGNVTFGYTGGLVQYPLSSGYTCPSTTSKTCTPTSTGLTFGVCGGTSGTDGCYQCCQNSDCASNSCVQGVCAPQCTGGPGQGTCPSAADPNAGVKCTSNVCVYTCNTTYSNCTGTPQTSATACTPTATDPNNCGGCNVVCSNVNITTPTCSAGVCNAHCNDGYIHCTGTRQATGCETAVSCGACCGSACNTTGTKVCEDPGASTNGGNGTGIGACATAPTGAAAIQASATASEGNLVSVECPGGQPITAIVFADYGLPSGKAGQSWKSACANVANPTASANCTGTTGPDGLACQYQAASGTCVPDTCFTAASSSACTTAGSNCTWNTLLGVCLGSVGFAHPYGNGTTTDNINGGYCSYDVAADIGTHGTEADAILNPCGLGTDGNGNPVGTCAVEVANYNWGTTSSVSPNLAQSPIPADNSVAQPWSDPCSNIPNTKTFAIQVSCGACPTTSAPLAKRVFETNETVQGNLSFTNPVSGVTTSGIAGANAMCTFEAEFFGLTTGASGAPTFKAWVGSTATDPAGPGTQAFTQSAGPYVLVDNDDNSPVAPNWTTLVTTGASNGIGDDIDTPACGNETFNSSGPQPCTTAYPTGNPVTTGTPVLYGQPWTTSDRAWTGVDETGNYITGGTTSVNDCLDWTSTSASNTGYAGNGKGHGGHWSEKQQLACNNWQAIFCFEQ